MDDDMPSFYEFFSGGGMARAGLGPAWRCVFANDNDEKKAAAYIANWGDRELRVADVAALTPEDIPGPADVAWASFPCQDLSLAGGGAGLRGKRSGTFWSFWRLMETSRTQGRAPRMMVLENVPGALCSHGGRDFAAIGQALADANFMFGAVAIDAKDFLPQSRPRLFIIAVADAAPSVAEVVSSMPVSRWHPERLIKAHASLSAKALSKWVWWTLPAPPPRNMMLADVIEENPRGVAWSSPEETRRLLSLMSALHLDKVEAARASGRRVVGCVYRRTRPDGNGNKTQRAEVRFDDIAGCLRTPAGGSSRQSILVVEGKSVSSRLLSPREAARLMGLPESYILPGRYNEAYHLAGDGVAVPVVRFLARHILEPVLADAVPAMKNVA